MSKYKLLFNHIKSYFPSNYRVTFGSQEENREESIGVFFQGGTPKKKLVNNGEYLEHIANVVFNINAKKDYKAVEACIEMLEQFVQDFNRTHDFTYSEKENSVTILYTELFGDINMLGFNSTGIPCYSLNFLIHYK